MAKTTIEWADYTFNPWEGCTKVSPGCAHCYAEARNKRFKGGNWGKGAPRRLTSDTNWELPVRWNNAPNLRRPRVFCPSIADWLDEEVPTEWLARLLKLIYHTPNLDWILLTKRPENWERRIGEAYEHSHRDTWQSLWIQGEPPPNIWLGTSVEDQKRADERIPELLKIPAAIRFLSVEPMLEWIDLAYTCFNGADSFGTMPGIHWAIFGGESGPGARPCNIDWIRDGVRQCRSAGVTPFVKQLGAKPVQTVANQFHVSPKPIELKDKKGGDWSEWPEDLRVREFPNSKAVQCS